MNKLSGIFKSKLISNYSVYLGSNILSSAIPFIFLPILTRYLSPEDYGIVVNLKILLAIFSILIGVNTHGALNRSYFKLEGIEFKKYLYNLLLICLIGFSIIFLLAFIFIRLNYSFMEIPKKWIFLIVLVSLFEACSKLILSLWRAQENPLKFGLFNILKTLVNISLSLFLVVRLDMGWQGRGWGIVSTSLIFGLLALQSLWRNQIFNDGFNIRFVDSQHLKNALHFGLPLIPHALSGWIINYIDRFFIASMIGLSQVGIYSVAYQIGNIIGTFALSFNQAWSPFLFKQLKKNSESIKIKLIQFTYAYFLMISCLAIFLSLGFSVIAPVFVGQNFQQATQYVIWVALGYAANGMYFMVVNYIFYAEKNYYLPFITVFSAIVNIVLNYMLIRHNGTIGAAQATTITYVVTFLLTWRVSNHVYTMPWSLKEIR